MTYSVNDRSVASGAPVEFYKFTGPFGTFRYISDNKPGVCNGELYVPLPGGISRSATDTSTVVDSPVTCDITIPASSELSKLYCFADTPDTLRVEIRRAHRGDDWNTEWSMEWMGFGMDTSVSANEATIRTGSVLQSMLTANMASIYYQRSCNHTLFDSRCKVNKANWTIVTEIVKIQSSLITVSSDESADGSLAMGEIYNTRTGEIRSIHNNANSVITMAYRFTQAEVGDTVELVFGCDHKRLGDCANRFDNAVNYGGFDFIPTVNPFTELKYDSKITTTIKEDIARTRSSDRYSIRRV